MKAKTDQPRVLNLAGVVRTDKPHISNSYLSTLKRALIGDAQFFGSEHFLVFGTEHHKRALQPKEKWTTLEKSEEEWRCTGMAQSFRRDPRVMRILKGAHTEVEVYLTYRGALVLLYLDIRKGADVWDLKGTTCMSEEEFLKKAREFDYFRQASLYLKVPGVKRFGFIGQCKKDENYSLYFLNAMDYPHLLQEGLQELDMLIDTHLVLRKHYERKNKGG